MRLPVFYLAAAPAGGGASIEGMQSMPAPATQAVDPVLGPGGVPGDVVGVTHGTPVPAQAAQDATPSAMDPSLLQQAHHDSILGAVAVYSPAARVFVSAAIISTVIGARAATGGEGGARRLAFVNARLVPCLVKASVERHLEALSQALARGEEAASGLLHGGQVSSASGDRDPSRIQRMLDEFSDGFHDIVSGLPGDTGDANGGPRDASPMMQIGVAFGLAYLAILAVSLWATRRQFR